jgi:hypothetical protein
MGEKSRDGIALGFGLCKVDVSVFVIAYPGSFLDFVETSHSSHPPQSMSFISPLLFLQVDCVLFVDL